MTDPPPRRRPVLGRLLTTASGAVILVAALSLYVVVASSAGSNGEWSHGAAQIVEDARTSLLAARSVHLSGSVVHGLETDVYDITAGPRSAVGTITVSGVPVSVRVVGSDLYLRGRQFLTTLVGPEEAASIGERWVEASLDDPRVARFAPLRLSTLAGLLTTAALEGVHKAATGTRDGITVGALESAGGTVSVALDGTPWPRGISGALTTEDLDAVVTLTLSGYDLPLPNVTAPASVPLPSSPST